MWVSYLLQVPPPVPPHVPHSMRGQHVQHSAAENMRVKLKAPPHEPHPSFEGGSMCSTIHEHYRQVDAGIASSRLYIKQSRGLMQQLVLHPSTRTPARAKAGLSG